MIQVLEKLSPVSWGCMGVGLRRWRGGGVGRWVGGCCCGFDLLG